MTFALMPASGHSRRFNNVRCRSVMPLLAALVADMFDQQLRAINGHSRVQESNRRRLCPSVLTFPHRYRLRRSK